jgi:membrane glycosyltransferase
METGGRELSPSPPTGRYTRTQSILASLLLTLLASGLFGGYVASLGFTSLNLVRLALFMVTTYGLAWGAVVMIGGAIARKPVHRAAPSSRPRLCAIVVPICNEDPVATFSRVGAMHASLARLGALDGFHFVVLSDTRDPDSAFHEERWFARLVGEVGGAGQMFYRRRTDNAGKKAGNIADFIRKSGGQYDFLLFLDADSLMEGTTIVELVRRLDAAPDVALIQTLPRTIGANSLFGRSAQFASWFFAPAFARGLARVQGDLGVFWGHNAIARTAAFAASCGLPKLAGAPPFGGHILSHDYVEAAMLARSGWRLRLDADLDGSFEEAPGNLIDYAKRDRRWCQGNLQHARLLLAAGLKPWSRYFFLQGIMAYVASPLWLAFLLVGILAAVDRSAPDYFPYAFAHIPFPQLPSVDAAKATMVLLVVLGLLAGPKCIVALRRAMDGTTAGFGGVLPAIGSCLADFAWTSLLAPLMLMYQSRSVLQVLTGADGGWPPTRRDGAGVSLREAWAASWWIVAFGIGALAMSALFAQQLGLWLVLVALPMACAPLLIAVSSAPNRAGRRLFATPVERQPQPIVLEWQAILGRWRRTATVAPACAMVGTGEPEATAAALPWQATSRPSAAASPQPSLGNWSST